MHKISQEVTWTLACVVNVTALLAACATPRHASNVEADVSPEAVQVLMNEPEIKNLEDKGTKDAIEVTLSRLRMLSSNSSSIPCKEKVIDDVVFIDEDTIISCHTIKLTGRALLRVRGSFVLFLDAKEIVAEKSAKIDGSGAHGAPGVDGQSKGEWQSHGDEDYWSIVKNSGCSASDLGGQGGRGGPGGPGAVIVLGTRPAPSLDINVRGGAGGPGGFGGRGQLLKNGRNSYCNGCMFTCPSGPRGTKGEPGQNGKVLLVKDGTLAPYS